MFSNPRLIEEKSFEIISRLLALTPLSLPYAQQEVLKRVIHATTDLDFIKDLSFHRRAIKAGVEAIRKGKNIICDVGMVKAGINKKTLSAFGGKVICLINDKDVIRESGKLRIARAILAIRKASSFMKGSIVVIGNAPTALFELCSLVKKGKVKPTLIVGAPVGFVGAVESKKGLRTLKVPYITNISTKGGSSVAAAITNALLKLAEKKGGKRSD